MKEGQVYYLSKSKTPFGGDDPGRHHGYLWTFLRHGMIRLDLGRFKSVATGAEFTFFFDEMEGPDEVTDLP